MRTASVILASLGLAIMAPSLARAQAPAAKFVSVQQNHNVTRNGEKGILITTKCQVDGLKDFPVRVCAFFNWRNGAPLKAKPGVYNSPNGNVTSQVTVVPMFNLTDFNNIEIFVPVRALNITQAGKFELDFHLEIQYTVAGKVNLLADSGDYGFTLTNPGPGGLNPPRGPAVLAGSRWTGGETLAGYGALTFELNGGNQAVMIDRDGRTLGTWSQAGNQVTLSFFNGSVIYRGTVNGNTMSGSAANGKTTWTFSVSR